MQNINLYSYYDKSLAEINRDYIEARENEINEEPESGKAKFIAIGLAVFFVIAGVGGFLLYNYLTKTPVQVAVTEDAHYLKLSAEERLGYVSVQIFEFDDNATVSTTPLPPQNIPEKVSNMAQVAEQKATERINAYDERQKVLESIKDTAPKNSQFATNQTDAQKIKPIEVNKDVVIEQKPAVVASKQYSIIFENIDQSQYNTVQGIGAKSNIAPKTIDSYSETKTVWRVYKMDANGKIKISGKNVEFIEDFYTKEEAVEFAKTNNIQSIIRSEDLIDRYYTVGLCCTNIDKAKSIAQTSNIRDKVIKIIREK